MKFRNVTTDDLFIPALGAWVKAGETTDDLDEDTAAGFIGQVGKWSAVGQEAKAVQKDAIAAATPDEESK